MEYAEHPVPAALSGAIRSLWTLQGDAFEAPAEPQPVLPDGCAELILNGGAPFEELRDGEWQQQPARFLYGQLTKAIQLRPTAATAIVGVRFQPWGVYHVFGPQAVRADERSALAEIDAALDRHLEDEFRKHGPIELLPQLIHALEARSMKPVEPTLLRFIQALQAIETGPLDALKADAALSERQLERRFLAVVGLRPKLFARIIRLRRLIDLLHAGDTKGFAALAHAAGYFDQPHFNRDLKAFTGMAPRAYFRQELVLPDYFSGVR